MKTPGPELGQAPPADSGHEVPSAESVAELIVRCLENEGVTHVFGIPGEENIRLTQALTRSSIRYILVRHEQAASFMAEVYGRLTGDAGVCSSTLGPGAINMLLGVADATTNSTPVVAISAQVGRRRSFKESHQSVDLVSMFAPVTKWSELVGTPEAVPEMIRKAFKLAQTERPGAVYLAVPEDVEQAAAPRQVRPLVVSRPRPDVPSPSQLARAANVLRMARRPVVLAGHGAARAAAGDALRRFAEHLQIPVATTFHGKGVMPDDHPLALGAVGFMRHDYVNFGFDRADAIIAVGYELQEFDPVRINPNADKKIIHVHRFPAEVDAHYEVEVGIQADIGQTLRELAATVRHRFAPQPESQRVRALLDTELARGRDDDRFPVSPEDRCRYAQRSPPSRRRVGGHGRAEDVDGASVCHLRTEHLPDLQWSVDNGLDGARCHRREARTPDRTGPGRHRGRRLHDEFPGDRDRVTGAHAIRCPHLGRWRVRPHQMEDGARAGGEQRHNVRQPRLRCLRGELRGVWVPDPGGR
jgi:thiamine pyrophosphate-dependent acetolactate synthase large subunit-like protein